MAKKKLTNKHFINNEEDKDEDLMDMGNLTITRGKRSAQEVYERIIASRLVTPLPSIPDSFIIVDRRSFEAFERISEAVKPLMTEFLIWLAKKDPQEQYLIMQNIQQQMNGQN